MKKCGFLTLGVLLSACSITQTVTPYQTSGISEICIIEEQTVRPGFLQEFKRTLQEKGYNTRVLAGDANLTDCQVTSTYLAKWSWDLALYMSYAEIKVYESGKKSAEAIYDATHGGGRVFEKFVDANKKIRELVNELFPNSPGLSK